MPLYEMTDSAFRPLDEASFADLKVRERDDLQRLLRTQIDVLGDELYVLTEEFGDWDDSRRRIDLLAIDPQANLVVRSRPSMRLAYSSIKTLSVSPPRRSGVIRWNN